MDEEIPLENIVILIDVLYSTGCRVSELCNINLSDLDLVDNSLYCLNKDLTYPTEFGEQHRKFQKVL